MCGKGTVNLSGSMAGRYVIHVLASRLRLTGSTSGLSGLKWGHFCKQSNHPMAGREAMSALFAPVCADRVSQEGPACSDRPWSWVTRHWVTRHSKVRATTSATGPSTWKVPSLHRFPPMGHTKQQGPLVGNGNMMCKSLT